VPELPEVETIARSLRPRLTGRRILSAECTCDRILRGDLGMVRGLRVSALRRRGKFLIFEFEASPIRLTVHLGMTGKLLVEGQAGVHTHATFILDDCVLIYDDIRQFGRVEVSEGALPRTAALGPEPLEIAADEFVKRLKSRKAGVKALLLNQKFLGGVGNIYADEALHRAGIHPRASTARISRPRAMRLLEAIREVLTESIERGGSSISDYVDSSGNQGSFQEVHRVYGREGLPCPSCGTPVKRTVVAQRGTHYCPKCQR
jgi:formamidopyrimidine-DNA glycosylase